MKKILSLFLLLTSYVFAQNNIPQNPPAKMPKFVFYDLDRNFFTIDNLNKSKHTIVFFFDPFCDHCQKQTRIFTENASKLKNIQILFVSTEEYKALKDFYKNYLKGKGLNAVMLKDKNYEFDSYFSYSVAPRVFIYDKNGNFRKDFKNEASVDLILKALR